MKEIGGYLELDTYSLQMLHDGAIALNSGRNCLAYLIKKKNIKKSGYQNSCAHPFGMYVRI